MCASVKGRPCSFSIDGRRRNEHLLCRQNRQSFDLFRHAPVFVLTFKTKSICIRKVRIPSAGESPISSGDYSFLFSKSVRVSTRLAPRTNLSIEAPDKCSILTYSLLARVQLPSQ
ncbi:hypothetical protein TNCT_484591 [Trichonephila clavata]|uniref:Uncharacterized protein n=1 Tax=Trichonephila clavata TaxID=2740835 RepID=A0A8X6IKA7_TRICU|nr:hypothetical protein TNCT_484591 [Trichonephila clavata]